MYVSMNRICNYAKSDRNFYIDYVIMINAKV